MTISYLKKNSPRFVWQYFGALGVATLRLVLFVSGRTDRYSHDLEEGPDTEDETDELMFQSFSSCSPRYSRVYLKFEELKEVTEDPIMCTFI